MAGVIPRYPGSKASYPWLDDGALCSVIISPFLGACALTQKLMPFGVQHIFAADADYSVRAIWQAWFNPDAWPEVYYHCGSLKNRILIANGHGREALKKEFNEFKGIWYSQSLLNDCGPFSAALSLTLRACASAGGVIRTGQKSGRLNISPDNDFFKPKKGKANCKFAEWNYRFPCLPAKPPALSLSQDWRQALDRFKNSGLSDAVCILDPPYVGNNHPSYPGHKPKSPETLAMAIESIEYAAKLQAAGRIRRLIVCNYENSEIDLAVDRAVKSTGLPMRRLVMGKLDGCNQAVQSKNAETEVNWIIENPLLEQLQLLEI